MMSEDDGIGLRILSDRVTHFINQQPVFTFVVNDRYDKLLVKMS